MRELGAADERHAGIAVLGIDTQSGAGLERKTQLLMLDFLLGMRTQLLTKPAARTYGPLELECAREAALRQATRRSILSSKTMLNTLLYFHSGMELRNSLVV